MGDSKRHATNASADTEDVSDASLPRRSTEEPADASDASPPRRPRPPSPSNAVEAADSSDASPPRRPRASHDVEDLRDASPPRRPRGAPLAARPKELTTHDRRVDAAQPMRGDNANRKRPAPEDHVDPSVSQPPRSVVRRTSSEERGGQSSRHVSATSRASVQKDINRNRALDTSKTSRANKESASEAGTGFEDARSNELAIDQRKRYSFNRYQIMSGPRWDGLDRSNGFEQKLERTKASKAQREQQAYKMSVSDL